MAMPIENLVVDKEPSVFYASDFRRMLETHLRYLRLHPETSLTTLSPHDVYKYEGDFNGLCRKIGIPRRYHWAVMRINGIDTETNVDGSLTVLAIPPLRLLDTLAQRFQTTWKKKVAV